MLARGSPRDIARAGQGPRLRRQLAFESWGLKLKSVKLYGLHDMGASGAMMPVDKVHRANAGRSAPASRATASHRRIPIFVLRTRSLRRPTRGHAQGGTSQASLTPCDRAWERGSTAPHATVRAPGDRHFAAARLCTAGGNAERDAGVATALLRLISCQHLAYGVTHFCPKPGQAQLTHGVTPRLARDRPSKKRRYDTPRPLPRATNTRVLHSFLPVVVCLRDPRWPPP